jgi:hypothetical protein
LFSPERRSVIHFNVTTHPTAVWSSQQLLNAFPYDSVPQYIIRDRDCIYGDVVQRQLEELGAPNAIQKKSLHPCGAPQRRRAFSILTTTQMESQRLFTVGLKRACNPLLEVWRQSLQPVGKRRNI